MRTLLLILLSISATAQITTTPKIIFKASKADTISIVLDNFEPSHKQLTITKYTGVVYNALFIGKDTLTVVLDSLEAVSAISSGLIDYSVISKGVDVTPFPIEDNSLTNVKALLQNCAGVQVALLTTTQVRHLLAYLLYKNGIIDENLKVKKITQIK